MSETAVRRVRVPFFPRYGETRGLLRVLPGRPAEEVTKFIRTVRNLTGTPQDPVDWKEPETWIPERLAGADRDLAMAIWLGSSKTLNPRYLRGHWSLCRTYGLLADSLGALELSERGRSFQSEESGAVEREIDESEGLVEILDLVARHGPTRLREIEREWASYLDRHSAHLSPSVQAQMLRARVNNLLNRHLVQRSSAMYSATENGLAWLAKGRDPAADSLGKLVRELEHSTRSSLRKHLLGLSPDDFEVLVARLLEAMGYSDVEVTMKTAGDGGVDVTAEIEVGITSVREVVQAKRHSRTIQRHVLDALRGSLHRFRAVRGTIITTAGFSSGTVKAAFEPGAAPITLIDGDRLVDLLIEHGLGVRKRAIEVLEFDAEALREEAQLETE